MKTKRYSSEEIKILNDNPNVEMVKYGSCIEYKDSFKKWAVVQSMQHPELSAIQIFEMAGFDRNIVSSRNARERLSLWKSTFNKIYKSTESEIYEKQNNLILKTLLVRFEQLVSILGKKKK